MSEVQQSDHLNFLFSYMNNASPTGFEMEGQKIWTNYISPFVDEIRSDYYGTAYGIINPDHPYKVVVEAHADEISWFVNYINDDGFIYVIRNGGSDHIIAPSMRVNIHTPGGIVKGVFGWPAIHTRRGKNLDMAPALDNICIDIGAGSKAEVLERGIHVGCVVTYQDEFSELGSKYYCGRALDNRMGGYCIAQVARLIALNKIEIPFGLYFVNSVQEEIGLRGAEMIANTIRPNVAIVTDVTHDTRTPMINKVEQGDVASGAGPALTYAPSIHNKLLSIVIETAKESGIPFQLSAASRSTGTDTDAFAYSNGGIPSTLISLPLRYMHTTVEMAHKEDIENIIQLIYKTILRLDPSFDYKYF
ncbi:MAG: M42 family metallopeptidase [Bacteroidetes bacterium]|nr:M42 family metallopeptidase [Bacteroidota bacterium]